jgi:hypothetical protein
MMRWLGWRLTALPFATLLLGAALAIPPSLASPQEAKTAHAAMKSAAAGSFASRTEAERFLTRALPAATAANPKYRSPGSDLERRWLTREIAFHERENGGVAVSTRETFEDYRAGALTSEGTHEATFAIDDVSISDEVADDVAEDGGKARGVMFSCLGPPCIQAVWSGAKSVSASTDVYVQDAAKRHRILAAFRALQRKVHPR